MVFLLLPFSAISRLLSVLALSSRFDGHAADSRSRSWRQTFQYSLCRVVLMVLPTCGYRAAVPMSFSTRSVESF